LVANGVRGVESGDNAGHDGDGNGGVALGAFG